MRPCIPFSLRSSFLGLLIVLTTVNHTSAGIIQWRNRVPDGVSNPSNIGSYTSTIEIGNGGTTGYDAGLDVDLDTSIVPNGKFFVSYIDHSPHKVEYEFTQDILPGESYTALLSFENNTLAGSSFTANTVEFLVADGNFAYELAVDTNDNGSDDTFRSGSISDVILGGGEVTPWNQLLFPGNDHRNGWFYGVLTITNIPEPKSGVHVGVGLATIAARLSSRRKKT